MDDHPSDDKVAGSNGMVLIAPPGYHWSLPDSGRDRINALMNIAAHRMETGATGVITSARPLSPTVLLAEVSYSVKIDALKDNGLLEADHLTPQETK